MQVIKVSQEFNIRISSQCLTYTKLNASEFDNKRNNLLIKISYYLLYSAKINSTGNFPAIRYIK